MIDQSIISGGIFKKQATQTPLRLRQETEEFDVTQSLLESLIELEDSFFTITRDHMVATHMYLKDENVEILEEGFKDFYNAAVEFFEKLLKKFKEFMSKVFMYIQSWIGGFDKFLSKYKDKLGNLNPDFSIRGYDYTFDSSVPQLNVIQIIINDYNSELSNLKNISKADITKEREEFTSEEYLAKMRAYILGASSPVYPDEFVEEARKVFRGGMTDDKEIKVTKSVLNKAVEDYAELKKTFNECVRQRDKTIILIESLKEFFKKSGSVHYKGRDTKVIHTYRIEPKKDQGTIYRDEKIETTYSADNLEKINLFYDFKWKQAKEIGFMAVTAMTEKVNALKEALKQNEKIIRGSIFGRKKPEDNEGGEE